MKNYIRKNFLLMAAITLLLVMGTAITPMQSYASEEHKKNGDIKSSTNSDTDVNKKSAGQKIDQDNLCYRGGDDCEQANQGQQIVGKDNEAKGFNDQSRNLQSTPATAGTAGGIGNNGNNGNGTTPTPTPSTTGTLNVCKIVGENPFDIKPSDFTFTFTSDGAHPAEFAGSADCTTVAVPEGPYSFGEKQTSGPNPGSSDITVSGACTQESPGGATFIGRIKDGETQTCTVNNVVIL